MVKAKMIQNYLIIENGLVTNCVVWSGSPNDWQPPKDSITLPQATTPAMVWLLKPDYSEYYLGEEMGVGGIGFTWDGSILTTNQAKPTINNQE